MPLARFLKVDKPLVLRARYPLEFDKTENDVRSETREFEILPSADVVGEPLENLGLPKDALVLLVRRDNQFLVPRGHTVLQPYDTLLVLGEKEALLQTRKILLKTHASEE